MCVFLGGPRRVGRAAGRHSGRWVWADPGLRDSWFVFVPEGALPCRWVGVPSLNPAESFLSICRFAPSRLEGSRRDGFLSEPCAVGFWPLLFGVSSAPFSGAGARPRKTHSACGPRLRRPSGFRGLRRPLPQKHPLPGPLAPAARLGFCRWRGRARPERQGARAGRQVAGRPVLHRGPAHPQPSRLPPGPERGGREARSMAEHAFRDDCRAGRS